MKLAGRCECGVLDELARGDEHLPCKGLRRCRKCRLVMDLAAFRHVRGESNPRHVCLDCQRVMTRVMWRMRMQDPERRAERRAYDRQQKKDRWHLDHEWKTREQVRHVANMRKWRASRKVAMLNARYVDRTNWPRGPWDREPDRVEWRDRATGLPCLIVRAVLGALCGYVAVPPGHKWHGVHYDKCNVVVHGGLTYAARCQDDGLICHVPRPGEPEDVWWFGFDCAHFQDLCPGVAATFHSWPSTRTRYRTVAYVRAEVRSLARQVAGAR